MNCIRESKITRKVVSSLVTLGLAIVLLGVLFQQAGTSLQDITNILSRVGPVHALLILFGTASPVALGAWKWKLVIQRVLPRRKIAASFFAYFTAMSVIVGQVTSPYVSGPLVRGLALRRLEPGGFGKGAATSGFEQLFDAWATLVFAVAGIVLILAGASLPAALWGLVVAAALGGVAVHLPVHRALGKWLGSRNVATFRNLGKTLQSAEMSGLFDRTMLASLYWLSVARFWVLVLAAIAVAQMTTGDWQPAEIAVAFAAAKITRFAAIAPGNLGIEEWGWVVVLVGLGWSLEQAAAFSISLRILGLAMMLPVFVVTVVWRMSARTETE